MESNSDYLPAKVRSGETVVCPKCNKGVLKAVCKEGVNDISKCCCFACDNCDYTINTDDASTADLVVF